MGSLVDEKRLLLKVPERCRIGTLSAEKDIVYLGVLSFPSAHKQCSGGRSTTAGSRGQSVSYTVEWSTASGDAGGGVHLVARNRAQAPARPRAARKAQAARRPNCMPVSLPRCWGPISPPCSSNAPLHRRHRTPAVHPARLSASPSPTPRACFCSPCVQQHVAAQR